MSKKSKTSPRQPSLFPKRPMPQMPEGYYSSGPNLRWRLDRKLDLLWARCRRSRKGSRAGIGRINEAANL